MDYIPRPSDPLPGIDVPLLDILPLRSAPKTKQQIGELTRWYRTRCPSHIDIDAAIDNTSEKLSSEVQLTTHGLEYFLVKDTTATQHHSDVNLSSLSAAEIILHSWYAFPIVFGLLDQCDRNESNTFTKLANVFQSWAFFGLLEVLFGERIDQAEWTRSHSDGPIVQWPARYLGKLELLIQKPPDASLALVIAILDDVCYLLERYRLAITPPFAQVLVSVRILGEALKGYWPPRTQHASRFLTMLLLERGWCPSVAYAQPLVKQQQFTMMHYLLTMRNPGNDSVRHSKCTPMKCSASNVSMDKTYQKRHITRNCTCEDIGVDTAEVTRLIARGRVPLVRIKEKDGQIKLSLKAATRRDEYIAISHVWSDGLGNPTANSLPECQVRNLLRLARRMPKHDFQTFLPGVLELDRTTGRHALVNPTSVLLWMDTMCIPVSTDPTDKKIGTAKTQAIDRMNLIYSCARRVMVLDQKLLNIRLYTTSLLEIYARIIVCPWRTRCWTYQEGALALRCHFELADVSIDPQYTSKWLCNLQDVNGQTNFASLCRRWQQKARLKHHVAILSKTVNHRDSQFVPEIPQMVLGLPTSDSSTVKQRLTDVCVTIISSTLSPPDEGTLTGRKTIDLFSSALKSSIDEVKTVSSSLDRMMKFTTVWNALSLRASTYVSDTDLIFANMLELAPTDLPGGGKPHEQRLQAILWSLELLPLDLLLNTGPRLNRAQHGRNSWVPTQISETAIMPSVVQNTDGESWKFPTPPMRLHAGFLWTRAEVAPMHFIVQVKTNIARSEDLFIDCGNGAFSKISTSPGLTDSLDEAQDKQICFLFHKTRNDVLLGCRLYILWREEHDYSESDDAWGGAGLNSTSNGESLQGRSTELFTIYNCPVTYWSVPWKVQDMPSDAVVIKPQDLEEFSYPSMAWKLKIACDEFTHKIPAERRTLDNKGADMRNINLFFSPCWIYVWIFWLCFCVPMRVVITAQLGGWSNTDSLYKASTIMFALYALAWPLPIFLLFPTPEWLFLASRLASQDVRAIDIAYATIAISFMTFAWLYAVLMGYVALSVNTGSSAVISALNSSARQQRISRRKVKIDALVIRLAERLEAAGRPPAAALFMAVWKAVVWLGSLPAKLEARRGSTGRTATAASAKQLSK